MEQEKQPQQAIPPEELAHLADILKMVNAELEEAQLSGENGRRVPGGTGIHSQHPR